MVNKKRPKLVPGVTCFLACVTGVYEHFSVTNCWDAHMKGCFPQNGSKAGSSNPLKPLLPWPLLERFSTKTANQGCDINGVILVTTKYTRQYRTLVAPPCHR